MFKLCVTMCALILLACSEAPSSPPDASRGQDAAVTLDAGSSPATGGARGTGGAKSTGGARATGGGMATGGSLGTGGAVSTGGALGTGGQATQTTSSANCGPKMGCVAEQVCCDCNDGTDHYACRANSTACTVAPNCVVTWVGGGTW
jgi:hypothetical protein